MVLLFHICQGIWWYANEFLYKKMNVEEVQFTKWPLVWNGYLSVWGTLWERYSCELDLPKKFYVHNFARIPMKLTRFDKAAAGTNMEEKKLCDPKNLKWHNFYCLWKLPFDSFATEERSWEFSWNSYRFFCSSIAWKGSE